MKNVLGTIQRRLPDLGLPERSIILSFDDGPVPGGQSMALLDLLSEEEIQAAFCLVGRRVPGNEAIVQRIQRDQHLIVNHGEMHRAPQFMTAQELEDDMVAFDRTLGIVLSEPDWKSQFYRPPGGKWNPDLEALVSGSGRSLMPMTYFAWDIFAFPMRRKLILEGFCASLRIHRGGVFMLHEAVVPLKGELNPAPDRTGREWVVELMAEFIARAKRWGFQFIDPSGVKSK